MKKNNLLACATLLAGVAFASSAFAQQWRTAGPVEYDKACAACHGAKADGNGPLEGLLKDRPADLTMLKKNNGGVFPFAKVFDIIDGRNNIRAHGADMPVWGDRFAAQAMQGNDKTAAEIDATGRIAVLVFYLASIQK
jgi:mono/diheme cytochrome c family protein